MSRVSRARRIATAAAYGGGGIGVLGAIAAGLIVSQINHAHRTIGPPEGPAPGCDGTYGDDLPSGGPGSRASGIGRVGGSVVPLRLAVLGDSSAVGLGVQRSDETPGAVLARNLARIAGRPVQLCCFAVVGALSADLPAQVTQAHEVDPELAFIMIGGNDVTHRVWP
ncbi:MAG: GDSL-type esterase/lipase family protein, partial [Micromonosporaceae bacterium]